MVEREPDAARPQRIVAASAVTRGDLLALRGVMKGLRSKLPPPNSIVVFEAAARHKNFTLAARELNVTQAAVSRQIKIIEDDLGFPVFLRTHRAIKLTEEGRRFYDAVVKGLGHIADTAAELKRHAATSTLTVAVTFAFATFWLVPRIAAFRALFPDIELRIVTSDEALDFTAENIDVGVRYGAGHWRGLTATRLLEAEIFPVCSPSFLSAGAKLETSEDLLDYNLLEMETTDKAWTNWAAWFEAFGIDPKRMRRQTLFNNFPICMQATMDGQGIALGWRPYADDMLARGVLMRPISATLRPQDAYYLTRPERRESRNCALFCEWILRQAAAEEPATAPPPRR
jgi:putative choline sulfate-utilization transcription factor